MVNKEIKGWFQLVDSRTSIPLIVEGLVDPNVEDESDGFDGSSSDIPCIFVSLTWNPPASIEADEETQRETSYAIQEELVRSSILDKQKSVDIVGSSLGAVNTALGMKVEEVLSVLFWSRLTCVLHD